MVARISGRGNQRNLQVHGFKTQRKRIEIVGETLQHIRHHHGLRAHGHSTFGQIAAIRQHGNLLAANPANLLHKLLGCAGSLNMPGLRIQANRAHRHRAVIQLLLLAQKTQRMLNALARANNHRGIRVGALLTAEQHQAANHKPLSHGDQQRAHHDQRRGKQGNIRVENKIDRTHHNAGEHRALEQQQVQLVAVTHHMPVIHAHAVHAQRPDQRAHNHIHGQTDMEMETSGIQRRLIAHHKHNHRSEHKRGHIANSQCRIDEEPPIRNIHQLLPRCVSQCGAIGLRHVFFLPPPKRIGGGNLQLIERSVHYKRAFSKFTHIFELSICVSYCYARFAAFPCHFRYDFLRISTHFQRKHTLFINKC